MHQFATSFFAVSKLSWNLKGTHNSILNDAQPCCDTMQFKTELRGCFPLIYVTVKCSQINSKFKTNLCQILGQLNEKGATGLLQGCRLEYGIIDQCKQNQIITTKLKALRFALCSACYFSSHDPNMQLRDLHN